MNAVSQGRRIGRAQSPAPATPLRRLLAGEGLDAHFQAIASLRDGEIFGYEGLVRGPQGSAWRTPATLFAAARDLDLSLPFEITCARRVIESFVRLGLPGRVAVNLSGASIERLGGHAGEATDFLLAAGLSPRRVVVELTEQERINDPTNLKKSVGALHRAGFALALDDFGDGRSSLRVWAELAPEFVKIDKYFIRGLHADPARFQCVKAMIRLGEVFGTRLIAEGIETEAELRIVRDLGIEFGQGHLLGQPVPVPPPVLATHLLESLRAADLAVFPETVKLPSRHSAVGELLVPAPVLTPATTNNEVVALFAGHPELHAMAVVDAGRPVGIVNRRLFMDRYALPFRRELFGRRPCTAFMNDRPLVVERGANVETLTQVLTGEDQRYLSDGLVIVEAGLYAGLATGEALVRAVAEVRIAAARYANPLTFLPGNIPISEHIARLLDRGAPFTACYCDLNHFKPYNDQYGYWRGDEMIQLAARELSAACDPLRDFLGHVGGDDFVVLFQSADWEARLEGAIARFDATAPALFDPADRQRGGITAEDRQGHPAFFPLTTLSAGAVDVIGGRYRRPEDVATAAALAKREAKHRALSVYRLPPA